MRDKMQLPNGFLLQGGQYRIVCSLGSGGFGCTYEAEHTGLRKRFALKEFFVKDYCDRDDVSLYVTVATMENKVLVDKLRGKFVKEARVTAMMNHPHIVKVYDVFEENGTAYYVMDYIEGPSLDKLVRVNGPLPENTALNYIRQVADALAYVHSLNRLHLDLKPANIMTDGRGNAILVDFGVSKQYDADTGENNSTLMGKTRGYAPIEQMGNDVGKFTPATDIYALGATLYKILTGNTPPNSAALASEEEELPPLPRNISQGTVRAINASMQVAKSKRPQSVDEFLSILNSSEETVIDGGYKGIRDEATIISSPLPLSMRKAPVSSYAEAKKPVTRDNQPNHINGYEYVDLGLSVRWATCNIGASSPSSYGDYFAWGETRAKSEYTTENSVTYNKGVSADIAGNPQYDAARANLGGTWRMPTEIEFRELINDCEWKWTSQDGHKGYRITGYNGNSIFLPAAGWRYKRTLYFDNRTGYYWTSTPGGGKTDGACSLEFTKDEFNVGRDRRRCGQPIRPVTE